MVRVSQLNPCPSLLSRHATKRAAPVQQRNAMLTPSGPTDRTCAAGAKASGCPARAPSASNTSSRWLSNGTVACDASVHFLGDGGPFKPEPPSVQMQTRHLDVNIQCFRI